jgi:TorA maturation chaperone TorD
MSNQPRLPALAAYVEATPAEDLLGFLSRAYLLAPDRETAGRASRRLPRAVYAVPDKTEALRDDYYDLFLVPSSGRYLPPFESVFREKTLWGKSASAATLAYSEQNFQPEELHMELMWQFRPVPDHIGFETAFVAELLERAKNGAPSRPAAKAFFDSHLRDFSERFGTEVERRSRTRFYKAVGGLTRALSGHLVLE